MQEVKLVEYLEEMYGIIGLKLELVKEALTHSSFKEEMLNTKGVIVNDYERLECRGDANLRSQMMNIVFDKGYSQGEMTQFVSNIVSANVLKKVASSLDLSQFVYVGNGFTEVDNILDDVYEALVGVIDFCCEGDVLQMFIEETVLPFYNNERDPISVLKEIGDKHPQYKPIYEYDSTGLDHNKWFITTLTCGNRTFVGEANKKKESQRNAARKCVKILLGK